MSNLGNSVSSAVVQFSQVAVTLDAEILRQSWPISSAPNGCWRAYEGSTREIYYRIYQELEELAARITSERQQPTAAQILLAQHQLGYRHFAGALAGVRAAEIDTIPLEGEWPIRTIVGHVATTERGFHALIDWAVKRQRDGSRLPLEASPEQFEAFGGEVSDAGTFGDLLDRYREVHERVLTDLNDLTDADLNAPNIWWEGYEIPVRFRMHRFNAHLREHTVQVDKTLHWIGNPPNEPERLIRAIYQALGDVEGALIGAADTCSDQQQRLAADIEGLSDSIRTLVD